MSADDDLLAALDPLVDLCLRHIIPLFNIPRGKRPSLVGTGFLVEANGEFFLVTAAHVLDYMSEPGSLHYYIDAKTIKKVGGRVLTSRIPLGGTRKNDRLDFGVVKLR